MRLHALLLALLLLGLHTSASCVLEYSLKFKPNGEVGTPSFISSPFHPVPFRLFATMPPVILTLRYQTITASLIDLSLDGTVVQAIPVPDSMRLGGDTVQLYQGIASFQSLQVQSILPGERYRIMFLIAVPAEGGATRLFNVSTGPLVEVANPNYKRFFTSLRFGSYGWLFPSRTSRTVPDGVTPPFSVELVDALGFVSTASATISVTFVSATSTPLRAGLVLVSPSRFTALGGSATVSLTIAFAPSPTTATTGLPIEGLLNFTVSNGTRTLFLTTDKLKMTVLPPLLETPRANFFMGFDPVLSLFSHENIGNTAVIGVPLSPVVINLYNSQYQADTSSTGQFVLLANAEGATLQGNAALVINGVATFSDLVFTAPSTLQSVVITFTCNQEITPAALYSGSVALSIAPIKSTHILFHALSELQSNIPNTFVIQPGGSFLIATIVVQMKDSAYLSDFSATGAIFRLSAPLLNFSIGTELTATMVDGIAVFTDVNVVGCAPNCSSGGPFPMTITGPPYVMSSLTASIYLIEALPAACTVAQDIFAAPGCQASAAQYSLQFLPASESYVHRLDQDIFGTVGSPLPEVRLALHTQTNQLVNLEAAQVAGLTLYAFTDSLAGPSAEKLLSTAGSANIGTWKGRYWSFGCLLFTAAPTGLPKLQFGFGQLDPASGKIAVLSSPSNQTGFVTVVANPTSNYGMRFASDWSHLQFSGQPSSGVLYVTLPTIQLHIVDSLHALDTSGLGIAVSATASGGNLVSSGAVTFVSGVANFTSLRFQAIASSPQIIFTVSASVPYPVAGASVSTGPISLTTTFIRNYDIQFKRVTSCPYPAGVMCVVRSNQPFTFAAMNLVHLAATIIVKDSTSQQQQRDPGSTDPDQFITVTATSHEAAVSNSDPEVVWTTTFATTAEGALLLKLDQFRSAYAASTPPIYIRLVVTGGAPTLIGRTLTIGPITIAAAGGGGPSGAGGGCTTSLNAPLVVANFFLTIQNFTTSLNKTVGSVAQLLGIESSRVHVRNYSVAAGIVASSKRRWVGTKATFQFDDPTPTSANRASSAVLASQFIALRPDCQQTPLALANVYVENADFGCNPTLFFRGINESAQCTLNGDNTQCICYNQFLIDPYGVVCVDDLTVRTAFVRQCELLSTCLENTVQGVCAQILVSRGNQYLWAFAAFGGLVGALGIGYFLAKKIVLHASKVTLSRDDK